MARPNSLRRRALASLLAALVFAPSAAFAQDAKKSDQQPSDVMSRERNRKPELKKVYKDWLNEDVTYIIRDEERKAFKKLATDEEREQFIEGFWRKRDPDPDTDENEYKEEYYERIAYANEHFASGIPGWKTDRGRIYIMFGKPDEKESHPSGGSYQRESYEGGGSTTTYPFEKWFYRYIEGVGSGVEIEFVDPTGSGEYRIARSPEEKDALLNIPGAGLTLSEQLGLSNKADRVAFGAFGGTGSHNSMREQDSPFTRLQLLADLNRPPAIRNKEMADLLGTNSTIEENPLNFDLGVDYFRQSDERIITAFTVQTENKDLQFQDVGGIQTARMNIFGRITSVNGRRVGVFEDVVTATATAEELVDMRGRKSAYGKTVPLPPGTYRVDVVVRDVNSGATQIRRQGFTVPKYDPKQLATSTLVLATRLESLSDQPAVGQFTIGNLKVIPNLAATYRRGSPVGVYMQVYNAGIDQTTLRPSVDVDYVVTKGGKEIGKIAEDWRGMSDAGQRLTLAKLFTTERLSPGDYQITVNIRDRVSGQSLSPSAKFTVVE
ncbi:MAG TPA: GWxTD domain-containing protein [Pyrinomonadaceae bacterium]|nr:GWxTD domain-containing protein [Pyrinomonadaceae bacterium]